MVRKCHEFTMYSLCVYARGCVCVWRRGRGGSECTCVCGCHKPADVCVKSAFNVGMQSYVYEPIQFILVTMINTTKFYTLILAQVALKLIQGHRGARKKPTTTLLRELIPVAEINVKLISSRRVNILGTESNLSASVKQRLT